MIDFLLPLPRARQQPNLLLAAVRACCGLAEDGAGFCDLVSQHAGRIRQLMLARATQTNEPARCATLLPLLARLPQPLALLEVGTSAGLCLYPDLYSYRYGDHELGASKSRRDGPVFDCAASENTPLPDALPTVAWRKGIDLDPIDLRDEERIRWLEQLVWPEQTMRVDNLRAALTVARRVDADLVRGNLLDVFEDVASEAPQDATLVVFHSAVLTYLSRPDQERFVAAVTAAPCTWI